MCERAREDHAHVLVLNQAHLGRVVRVYLAYYHEARAHLSLDKDVPQPRRVERPDRDHIVAALLVGGLHHRDSRQAA